jgi:hypothetical protein
LVRRFQDYRRKLAPSAKMLEKRQQFSHTKKRKIEKCNSQEGSSNMNAKYDSKKYTDILANTTAVERTC